MTLPDYLDPREIARASGALSVVQAAIDEGYAQRDLMLQSATASNHVGGLVDTVRELSSMNALREQATLCRELTFDHHEQEISAYREMLDPLRQMNRLEIRALDPLRDAVEAARCSGALALPDVLEQFRAGDLALAARVADAHSIFGWHESLTASLNTHTALAGMLDQRQVADWSAFSAIDSVTTEALAGLNSVRQTFQFLDISGLIRIPRMRSRTREEQRHHVNLLVKVNAPSLPVKKAHSLIHRHEKVLRMMICQCMEDEYGDDWARERLPLCGCAKLLGKTLEDDETILDHADYAHYAKIMCHIEHFEAVFADGYEDAELLEKMIGRLGALRARAHHARTFTREHLREMTVLWRVMGVGFEALLNDTVFEH